MFKYFEKNFSWSFAVSIAAEMGSLNEIDSACAPLIPFQSLPPAEALDHWARNWEALGDKLVSQADRDAQDDYPFSAGMKLLRASAYYQMGERLMLTSQLPQRIPLYRKSIEAFSQGVKLSGHRTHRVEIPYEGGVIAGWLALPEGSGPFPCLIFANGFDSTKEILYFIHHGISMQHKMATFFVDQGGSGEALRFDDMKIEREAEKWIAPVIDHLEQEPGIDRERIGIIAVSFGGYVAPRAAAYEKRIRCCVAIGANPIGDKINPVDFAEELSVPEIAYHAMWLTGAKSPSEARAIFAGYSLVDALPRITCPLLVAHGEDDKPIPMEFAEWVVRLATNSAKAELRKFTSEEGASYHCGIDDPVRMGQFCYSWAARELGGAARYKR